MQRTIGLIGGTGFESLLREYGGKDLVISTPFGDTAIKEIEWENSKIYLINRHGLQHNLPPHKVPYAAYASALKILQTDACFSTAAVGSINSDWGPGTYIVCSDFIDFSARNITLFEAEVHHVDFSDPFSAKSYLSKSLDNLQIPALYGTYANMNGPRYETPSEVKALKVLGADIVGMTVGSEAIVMREASVPYACLAIVTNMAAGLSSYALSHSEVSQNMARFNQTALNAILGAIQYVAKND